MAAAPVDEIVGECLAVRVRMIARAVTAIYDNALQAHGLSIAQVNLLAALGKVGSCPPVKLGEVLQLERSTVSRNLSLLRKHGWIEAVSSDAKGIREISLTRSGRQKIASVIPDWRRAQGEAAKLLGTGGVKEVRTVANHLGDIPVA